MQPSILVTGGAGFLGINLCRHLLERGYRVRSMDIADFDYPERRQVDAMRADIRNPAAVRPWQHVLSPLSGYLLLAQSLWDTPELAGGWNFGPGEEDARPVSWIVEQLRERWAGRPRWEADRGPHPHEAAYLKLDSSRARLRLGWRPQVSLANGLASIVEWHEALVAGDRMRAVTLGQLEQLTAAADAMV